MEKKNILGILVAVIALAIMGAIVFLGVQKSQNNTFVPETSKITGDGLVVTDEGKPVKLDVEPLSPEAPHQSSPITEKEIPKSAVEIAVSADGFSPAEFTVYSGDAVSISMTSMDTQSHVFRFDSPQLSAVAVGVGPGETRLISFNAPAKGEYSFFCDVPGHKTRGEVGKMVVK